MTSTVNDENDDSKEELFSGQDLHRFVPLDSKIAKNINASIPMGVYGGAKKNDKHTLNPMKKSSLMVMELVPTQKMVKCDPPILQNENQNNCKPVDNGIAYKDNFSSYSFETIKKHYFDERYLPEEYNDDNLFMKDSLSTKKKQGDITMKQLIKQASGVITEEVAKNCRATGIGLKRAVSGEITQLMIYTYSENNQRITYGGYNFRILLTPYKQLDNSNNHDQVSYISLELLDMNEIFEGSVIDNHDGTYTASYICKKAVPHRLEIIESRNKLSIGESPFVIQVTPGKSYPELCWAEGEGLKYYNTDGAISTFKIFSVDRMGNRTKKGGDKYEVLGVGGIKIQQILDLKNGEYEVYYKVHKCNLDDYKEINIKLYGQYIKTPAFYPVSKTPLNDKLADKFGDEIGENNLLNKTILKFDNLSIDIKPAYTLSMVFKHFNEMKKMGNEINISIPNLVLFPEEKEGKNNTEIIKRLGVINELKDLETNNLILNEKIRASVLDDYKNNSLKNVTNQLMKHEEILNDLSKAIIMHCETGKEHDKTLIKDEKKLESELDEITDCQQRMFATYSCLQQGGIDSLPVSFELEDPEKVKSRQMKDRRFYIDTYNLLEKKLEEIYSRKEAFEKNRDEYTQKLHKTLITRQKSIIKTQRSYNRILDELDKVYLQLSKRQTRRQDLYKNLRPDSLQVFEGLENQRILDLQLKKNTVIKNKNEGVDGDNGAHKDDNEMNMKRLTGRDRRYNSYSCLVPTDPESPAFWFAEASYLRDEKEKINQYKKHDEDYNTNNPLTDNPQKIKRWDLEEDSRWISCPSSVSISFSTMKTPEIQPIKQKGAFKTSTESESLSQVKKEVVLKKRVDPMLPENMDEDQVNAIIQRDKERKKLLEKKSNVQKNDLDNQNISEWVKNPPNPKKIRPFYSESLDEVNEQLFNIVKSELSSEEKASERITETNLNNNYIDVKLLNRDVKLLPNTLWDKDFMLQLNNGATKKEDFERIKNTWQEQLKTGRELKKSKEAEKLKLMELAPRNNFNINTLNAMEYHDENSLVNNINNEDIQNYEWKRVHHTFEADPRDVPWEFLGEISNLDTLPNEELSKEELQKYIVESLVLDGRKLSNKRIQIRDAIIQEEKKVIDSVVSKKENQGFGVTLKNVQEDSEFDKVETKLKENMNRLKPKVSSLQKAKLLISRKNFDTRREQFEHDNF
ncbi:dictyostelium gelation factor-like filamin type immunoglobulin domain [Cryptosporidium canis]|uniref:Dictyostelium gelation factor-like filamin type immunoglobulin domain n=1 Tax=Cryptosporidium canis TaxID=195482 RepID=A0ABQ8P2K5_9CRYT|nr:dictyostelium gelation factor-like filamin type immunoglobulin domain [Cryptosporidium canis]KAJ1612254.1 dictyostelium gelation factor-like filamin type immunoglobulin domain [Cryptosporidium canis]